MKSILLALTALFVLNGCNKNNTPAPVQVIVQAAQGAICPVAQELADQAGAKLASMTGAADPVACGQALYAPLVNVNLCAQAIPQASLVQFKVLAIDTAAWKTIGDIPASALKSLRAKGLVMKPNGIISSVVCPLGIGVFMGVASAAIPPACQGSTSLSASTLDQAIVQVCQLVTAALP